jgi:hypothetical protein
MSTPKVVAVAVPRFRSALKKLSQHGGAALQPQKFVVGDESEQTNKLERWRKPKISKRVANVLRKQAVANGVYGSFDASSGIGWDPAWDVELEKGRPGGQGRYKLRVPKQKTHQRTREQRAVNIEKKMEGMDERIEEYYQEKQAAKPAKTFENTVKNLMKAK